MARTRTLMIVITAGLCLSLGGCQFFEPAKSDYQGAKLTEDQIVAKRLIEERAAKAEGELDRNRTIAAVKQEQDQADARRRTFERQYQAKLRQIAMQAEAARMQATMQAETAKISTDAEYGDQVDELNTVLSKRLTALTADFDERQNTRSNTMASNQAQAEAAIASIKATEAQRDFFTKTAQELLASPAAQAGAAAVPGGSMILGAMASLATAVGGYALRSRGSAERHAQTRKETLEERDAIWTARIKERDDHWDEAKRDTLLGTILAPGLQAVKAAAAAQAAPSPEAQANPSSPASSGKAAA